MESIISACNANYLLTTLQAHYKSNLVEREPTIKERKALQETFLVLLSECFVRFVHAEELEKS